LRFYDSRPSIQSTVSVQIPVSAISSPGNTAENTALKADIERRQVRIPIRPTFADKARRFIQA
jgi:hypothetical protein